MLVRTVPVGVHEAPALEYFDKRLQFQISARRNPCFLCPKIVPRLFVIARPHKGITHRFDNALTRSGITQRLPGLRRLGRTPYVLAHCELDSRRRVGDRKFFYWATPFEFDGRILAADRIGGPV